MPNGNGPNYFPYHADLFAGEEISCWEKHQMELEMDDCVGGLTRKGRSILASR